MNHSPNNTISEEVILKLKAILEKQHDSVFTIKDVREIAYELISLYELIARLSKK